ncbi:MAG TPA: hypothetical protein VMU10_01950, partial [Desulfomonilia bacterium]|nr:hypothetical protein [Desulfomonilia bacterium]
MKKIILFTSLGLMLAGVLFVAGESLNIYREMMKINTNTLWRLPTRIFSSSFDIAPGVDVKQSGL